MGMARSRQIERGWCSRAQEHLGRWCDQAIELESRQIGETPGIQSAAAEDLPELRGAGGVAVQLDDLQQLAERRVSTRLCRQRVDEAVGAAEKRHTADGQRATEKVRRFTTHMERRDVTPPVPRSVRHNLQMHFQATAARPQAPGARPQAQAPGLRPQL